MLVPLVGVNKEKLRIGLHAVRHAIRSLNFAGWDRLKTLSSRVRFICTPAKEIARGHRCTDDGDWTSCGSFHAAHFTCAERRHALRGVIDLLPTVQTNLISLLVQRERPCLAPMAAAKNNVVEKTKQALNPCHKITPPKASSRVGLKIVLLRCILHENVAFVVGKIQLSF